MDTYAIEMSVRRELPDGAPEDYCLAGETEVAPGCEAEPWGGWVLQGDARIVATFDPYVVCDGCANVTIDGVAAGTICDSWWAP